MQGYNNIADQSFTRDAIKARFIETAGLLHGYEHFELESFDPLVDLLFSALSKELEKSHQFLEDSYFRILENLTNKLLPNYYLDHSPAYTIIQVQPKEEITLTKDNFKASTQVMIDNEDHLLEFIPFVNHHCLPIKIGMIADGENLVQFNQLEKSLIAKANSNDNAIYLGLQIEPLLKSTNEVTIFLDWINNPNNNLYSKILRNSKWYLDEKELDIELGLQDYVDDQDPFRDQIFSKHIAEKIKSIKDNIDNKYFKIAIEDSFQKHTGNVPAFIKEKIPEIAELSFANNLVWIRIELLNIPATRELKKHIYASCNCVPVFNINLKHTVERIKEPFKVIRLHEEEFFIDIKSIENENSEYYKDHNKLDLITEEKMVGKFKIQRSGILRTNRKLARTSIRKLIDTIKEERNAYATYNPEWIIDELKGIHSHVKRIHHKLGNDLKISDSDIFLIFESEHKNDLVKIDYWTTNGENGNGIPSGEVLDIADASPFIDGNAIVLHKSESGTSAVSDSKKKSEFLKLLHSRNQLTTIQDYKLAIKALLDPLEVLKIEERKTIRKSYGLKVGYQPVIQFIIHIKTNEENASSLTNLQYRIKDYLEKKGILNQIIEPIIQIA